MGKVVECFRKTFLGYYGYWVILTYLSIISGATGIYMAISGHVGWAVLCMMISGICDMFDGPVAKLKKNRTDREKGFGIQIDSLADLISFGVLPVMIGYAIGTPFGVAMGIIIAAAYILTALIRLAYFNVIEAELTSRGECRKFYEGLPVTTVALILPLIYALCSYFNPAALAITYTVFLIVISVAFIARFRIPKLRGRYLIIFVLMGLPIVSFLLWIIIGGL